MLVTATTAATADAAETAELSEAAKPTAATTQADPAQNFPAEAETSMAKAVPAEAAPASLLPESHDAREGGSRVLPDDSAVAMVVSQTEQRASGALRMKPWVLPHAPPGFAARFRAVSEDPRFRAALTEDLGIENPDADLDYWCEVAEVMMIGGESGYIGQAG